MTRNRTKVRKILFLHESPVIGGAAKYLLDVLAGAVARGIETAACFCEPYTPPELVARARDAGAETLRLDLGLARPKARRIVSEFRKLLARAKPDCVFFNKRINWFDFRHMILAARTVGGVRRVAVEHYHPEPLPAYPPKRRPFKRIRPRQFLLRKKPSLYAHMLDAIICMNEAARRTFIEEYGYPADRTRVVYNGVDLSRFEAADRRRWRKRLGIADDELLVAHTGRHSHEKGVDILLESVALLPEEAWRKIRVALAGDGPEHEKLQSLARRLGVADRTTFLGVIEDVPGLLAAADLYVSPSRRESFGLSLAEAMASGLCAVATAVGGVPELIDSERVGLLVPPEQPRKIADAVLGLLHDEPLRKSKGRAAKKRIADFFTLEEMVQKTLDVIQGVGPDG